MHPAKVQRTKLDKLTDLPNIGPEMARDLLLLGYSHPSLLRSADPLFLYESLCRLTGERHDPCVLSVFISVTDFLAGADPRPWWEFTSACHKLLGIKSRGKLS